MGHIKLKLIWLIGFLGIAVSGLCMAADSIEVVRSNGSVTIKQDGTGEKGKHTLVTGPDGRAVVRVGKSGFIVLEKNTTIQVDRPSKTGNFFRQVTGMIYFALNSLRKSSPRTEIRTATATIGIRGTRFLVTELPDRNEVGVRKGNINIESPEGEFEIHRQAEMDEFEAFKREGEEAIAKERGEFEEYKANQQREFIEYKREFGLSENRMASFDGSKVVERELSEASKKDMESLESYAKDWLKEVDD